MGRVSTSCLGGQAATAYVLPHNCQSTFVNSNSFHQLALVLWGTGGTGNKGFEREGS